MNSPMYRPPAEAYSFLLQVDVGCPYNACTFCGMYKGVGFSRRTPAQVRSMLESADEPAESVKRVFLADGDVMSRPFEELRDIIMIIRERFPLTARINAYAAGTGILDKTPDQLAELRVMGLQTLYMGLESGDEPTLRLVHKAETAEQMIEAGIRAQTAGLHMSVMVLLGLAGTERSREHAVHTALALNRMQPRLLSCLRIVPVPGTEYWCQVDRGEISQPSEYSIIKEIEILVRELDLQRTVFRANHSSNVVPLEARLPRDKDALLIELRALLNSGQLDLDGPGRMPMSL